MSLKEDNLPQIAVLMTCHNRRVKTLTSLHTVFQQTMINFAHIKVFLVDDGSIDGTSEAVEKEFPEVIILKGCGNLFWNGGMRKAFEEAMKGDFDYYLWLNDDTFLFSDAIQKLLETERIVNTDINMACIITAATQDPDTKEYTYGGLKKEKHRLFFFFKVTRYVMQNPSSIPLPCATITGNCVLIPREVVSKVGNLCPFYSHGMGDTDYGIRAKKKGFLIYLAPGFLAFCEQNKSNAPWRDKSLPILKRWELMRGPKGVPIKELKVFTRQAYGYTWPIHWIAPYCRFWLNAFSDIVKQTCKNRIFL